MNSMDWIDESLRDIPEHLRRRIVARDRGAAPTVMIDGLQVDNFTSNDYLSLSCHPEVVEAGASAMKTYGAGAGSSRLISGTNSLVTDLEHEIADFKGAQSALVTTSGYAAALAVIPVLVEKEDGIAIDHGAHASLVAAARASGASLTVFHRKDPDSLDRALKHLRKRSARRILVVLDGLHSMDGDVAPLTSLSERFDDVMILLDDAHATGVLGPRGEGTLAHFGMKQDSGVVVIGNFAKALGSQGGFIAAGREVIDLVIQRSTAFIYTTGISPGPVGAALAALRILRRETERIDRMRRNCRTISSAIFGEIGTSAIPIIPVIVGTAAAALEAKEALLSAGALVSAIRPPTVPEGSARLRISIQADHRILVEGSDHSTQKRYLALLRSTSSEKIADPS